MPSSSLIDWVFWNKLSGGKISEKEISENEISENEISENETKNKKTKTSLGYKKRNVEYSKPKRSPTVEET